VQHIARLEHRLSDTGVDLNDARSHASRHDLALQVLEKDIADTQRAKRAADGAAGGVGWGGQGRSPVMEFRS
jgi:hypothetical protein